MPLPRFSVTEAIALLTCISLSSTAPAQQSEPAENAPQNYYLFVGPDLSISHDAEFVSIRKLSNRHALIDSPDGARVALGEAPVFKLNMTPKVSSQAASITELIAEETYASGTDPDRAALMDQMDQTRSEGILADQIHSAEQVLSTGGTQSGFSANPASNSLIGVGAGAQDEEGALEENTNTAIILEESIAQRDNIRDHRQFREFNVEAVDYDAIRLSFEISSEQPLADAYAVLLVMIEHEGETNGFTTYKRIGPVDQKLRRVKVFHEGFPPGFKITDTRVFIYNYGEEIATNLSEKRYDIKPSQAQEFVKLNHRGIHRRDTVSAAPAWSLAPLILQGAESAGRYDYDATVELDDAGNIVALGKAGAEIPEHVRTVLQATTFVPALEEGAPVASTLIVNIADYFKE